MPLHIVNDIRHFVFSLAEASVYSSCKNQELKFVMSFTIIVEKEAPLDNSFPTATHPRSALLYDQFGQP